MSDEATTETPKQKGKLKKMLIIVIGTLVLLGGGITAGIYATGGFAKKAHDTEEHEDPNRPKLVLKGGEHGGGEDDGPRPKGRPDPKKYQASYFEMEKSFTSNLRDSDGFVQLGLGVSTFYGDPMIELIKKNDMPLRSAVLLALADQDAFVISTPEGKASLQKMLAKAMNDVLTKQEGFDGIDDVYFTSFIIQ